jgi:hypothetical protein
MPPVATVADVARTRVSPRFVVTPGVTVHVAELEALPVPTRYGVGATAT